MERVGILINKLQEQYLQQAEINSLMVTIQLLQAELLQQLNKAASKSTEKVAIILPQTFTTPDAGFVSSEKVNIEEDVIGYKPVEKPEPEPEPIAPPVNEPEVPVIAPQPTPKPEPEPIPHLVDEKPWQRLFTDNENIASSWHIDSMTEIPTLAHQEKVFFEIKDILANEPELSLNDKLKQQNEEVVTILQETPVKDLKKAISINERHQYIQELFRGDENMYERSIKTINNFHIYAEAEFWIQRELKAKLAWDNSMELVKAFDQVVKRRFA